MSAETPEVRHKRLRMRSWRRGMREMDLLLGPFAEAEIAGLSDEALNLYEDLLSENDQDLYLWISRGFGAPERFAALMPRIRAFHRLS